MSSRDRSSLSKFAFYVGEGVHYLGRDIGGGVKALFGRREKEQELPPPTGATLTEILERIEVLQEQQMENSAFEKQLHALEEMVRIAQQQQQQIAQELSDLSEVLRRK